ncbi:MAG: hypothetical protein IPK53_12180 [bacterium]|nr:hypothetical protein [bacterium]
MMADAVGSRNPYNWLRFDSGCAVIFAMMVMTVQAIQNTFFSDFQSSNVIEVTAQSLVPNQDYEVSSIYTVEADDVLI